MYIWHILSLIEKDIAEVCPVGHICILFEWYRNPNDCSAVSIFLSQKNVTAFFKQSVTFSVFLCINCYIFIVVNKNAFQLLEKILETICFMSPLFLYVKFINNIKLAICSLSLPIWCEDNEMNENY